MQCLGAEIFDALRVGRVRRARAAAWTTRRAWKQGVPTVPSD